jgi:hypothetical protein
MRLRCASAKFLNFSVSAASFLRRSSFGTDRSGRPAACLTRFRLELAAAEVGKIGHNALLCLFHKEIWRPRHLPSLGHIPSRETTLPRKQVGESASPRLDARDRMADGPKRIKVTGPDKSNINRSALATIALFFIPKGLTDRSSQIVPLRSEDEAAHYVSDRPCGAANVSAPKLAITLPAASKWKDRRSPHRTSAHRTGGSPTCVSCRCDRPTCQSSPQLRPGLLRSVSLCFKAA